MAVWWGLISRRGRDRGSEGKKLMGNFYLISHHGYDVEKLTAPGSNNLNFSRAEKKFVLKR